MNNCVKVSLTPRAILLDFLDLILVCRLEHSVASNVIPHLTNVLTHTPQDFLVIDASGLEEAHQVINRVMAIGTAVSLANAGIRIAEDLLARVGSIALSATIHIPTDLAIGVTDIVLVLGVELVIGLALERLTPEQNTLLQGQANTLQEERIL